MDPAGRAQELEVIEHSEKTRVVRHTEQGGNATEYLLELLDGECSLLAIQTWPDGSVTSLHRYPDGRVEAVSATGIKTTVEREPHPQVGQTASYVSYLEVALPDGPTVVAERSLEIDRACTILPLSENCSLVEGVEIQPRDLYADRITETTLLDGGPRRLMRRSPAGTRTPPPSFSW